MRCRNLFLSLSVVTSFACNNAHQGDTSTRYVPTAGHEQHPTRNRVEHLNQLVLDNGEKWQSDENTRKHAARLISLVDSFNTGANADLNSYRSLSADMQKELTRLVSDCKMKGPEHEALHLWLQPVVTEVADLHKVFTAAAGKELFEKISDDTRKFNKYFY